MSIFTLRLFKTTMGKQYYNIVYYSYRAYRVKQFRKMELCLIKVLKLFTYKETTTIIIF